MRLEYVLYICPKIRIKWIIQNYSGLNGEIQVEFPNISLVLPLRDTCEVTFPAWENGENCWRKTGKD